MIGQSNTIEIHISGAAQAQPNQSPSLGGLNRSYHYDPTGLLQRIDLPSWRSQHFAYDSARRLVSALYYQQSPPRPHQLMEPGPGQLTHQQHWQCDPAGNRLPPGTRQGSHYPSNRIGEDAAGRYHCNHLGTPLALIDTRQQKIIWHAELDPWGNRLEEFNPEGLAQHIRVQGQHHDEETGLFYNRYRYSVPHAGRNLTQDPVGLRGGLNLFSYSNLPNVQTDPLGLDPFMQGNGDMLVYTNMSNRVTLIVDQNGRTIFEFETRNDHVSKIAGAGDPYTGDYNYCEHVPQNKDGKAGGGFGPLKWRTTDPLGRWIHGGGTGLPNPYDAPRQGWKSTFGCTRA